MNIALVFIGTGSRISVGRYAGQRNLGPSPSDVLMKSETTMQAHPIRLTFSVAALLAVAFSAPAEATVIVSATPTLTGRTLVGFDGLAEGTIITNQYPGVTFGQADGGTPMI